MSGRSLARQLPISWRVSGFSPECHPPIFLAPLMASMPQSTQQQSSFSTTSNLSVRAVKKRDGNTRRGESALRRTGTKYPNGMSKQPLPQPVLDPDRKIDNDPNHGLWEFFNKEREALTKPVKPAENGKQSGMPPPIGRAWTVEELRHKSWEDLHSLWYICCKERNRLATELKERKRLYVKVGDLGARKRDLTVSVSSDAGCLRTTRDIS